MIRKTDLYSSYRLTSAIGYADLDKTMSPQAMKAIIAKAKADKDVGALGVDVLEAAYDAAKAKAGGAPTRGQVREQVSRAQGSLANEKAKGRINDGYIDSREAELSKNPVALPLYKWFLKKTKSVETDPKFLKAKATVAQVNQAAKALLPIVDAGFKLYDPKNDDGGDGLATALRKACNAAGLSSRGRAVVLTALNGATTRSDGGDAPSATEVKALITNAQSKLKLADGALIVDFDAPEEKPTSKKDGVITGLEVDRTPAVTGMTSRALLQFAATV
ncbi:MAG: hypothetical protein IT381_04185 [Deltaproteobacteria bacterium]|nr:hypothetical protein [Deltaproteobacteria bacterium]